MNQWLFGTLVCTWICLLVYYLLALLFGSLGYTGYWLRGLFGWVGTDSGVGDAVFGLLHIWVLVEILGRLCLNQSWFAHNR